MTSQEPLHRFQKVYHQHVNDLIYFPLGDAYHFYQWMIANQFWSAASEDFEDVGPWVKRGLIVSKFLYPHFADKAGISTKTVSRYLKKIVEEGFAVILQQGGFVDKGRTKPFVVAIGAWRHRASDGMREAHYVGWMNTLDGRGGHISFEELQDAAALVAERGEAARAHLGKTREAWRLKKEAAILSEAEEDSGKTDLFSQSGKTELFSRGQTELFSATEIASTEIETEIKHSVAENSAPGAKGPKPFRNLGESLQDFQVRHRAWKDGTASEPKAETAEEKFERQKREATERARKKGQAGSPAPKEADDQQGGGNLSSSLAPTTPPEKMEDQPKPSSSPVSPPPSSSTKARKPKKAKESQAGKLTKAQRDALFEAAKPFVAGSRDPEIVAKASGSWVSKNVNALIELGVTDPEYVLGLGEFIWKQRPGGGGAVSPDNWQKWRPDYDKHLKTGRPVVAFGDKQGAVYADSVAMAEKLKAQYANPASASQAHAHEKQIVDHKELKL